MKHYNVTTVYFDAYLISSEFVIQLAYDYALFIA